MNESTTGAMRALLSCALAVAAGSGWAQAGGTSPSSDPAGQTSPGAATGAVIDKTAPSAPAASAARTRPAASAAASGATRGAASAASGARR